MKKHIVEMDESRSMMENLDSEKSEPKFKNPSRLISIGKDLIELSRF